MSWVSLGRGSLLQEGPPDGTEWTALPRTPPFKGALLELESHPVLIHVHFCPSLSDVSWQLKKIQNESLYLIFHNLVYFFRVFSQQDKESTGHPVLSN